MKNENATTIKKASRRQKNILQLFNENNYYTQKDKLSLMFIKPA